MAEYFKIGKFVAAHGVKGELVLKHDLRKKSSLKGLQALFTENKKDSFFPWFIASARIKKEDEVVITIDGVSNREEALKLCQKDVWFTETDFKRYTAKSSPINLLGYMIVDKGQSIGVVTEIIEQPHQMLCKIEINHKEVLIPLNEDTLGKVDHKKKQVMVTLPDGLLQIYLS